MHGSSAGLIRVGNLGGKTILSSSVVNSTGTGQGGTTQGLGAMLEAKGFSKWTFMLDGVWTGATVTLFGTIDANTAGVYYPNSSLAPPGATPVVGYPGYYATSNNWFQLSPVAGGGSNPLTSNGQQLQFNNPLLAVQAVVSAITSGTVVVLGFAVE